MCTVCLVGCDFFFPKRPVGSVYDEKKGDEENGVPIKCGLILVVKRRNGPQR